MEKPLHASDILDAGKKGVRRNANLMFKVEGLMVSADVKFERLDSKKILPFDEFEQYGGKRVMKKLIGYNRGTPKYFEAVKDEKGKWTANQDKPIEIPDGIVPEKVLMDTRTGTTAVKDTNKGLWFVKTLPASILSEFLIEDTYNFWSEEEADMCLKIYQYLIEHNEVGLYKFNPNGTVFHGFLMPQLVNGMEFRLLMQVARVKTNRPDMAPTMSILDSRVQEKEKNRHKVSALEEI